MFYNFFIRKILFLLNPEFAHNATIVLVKFAFLIPGFKLLINRLYNIDSPRLKKDVFGLLFKNPVGLAAGFDKNAKVFNEFASFGFGFIEIGTVTPKPQSGQVKPRLFRLIKDNAIINRMGFNNIGAHALQERLKGWKDRGLWPDSPVGINLGKSKVTPLNDAPKDYSGSLNLLWNHADFFVINVSSPNTLGLRELQQAEHLESILNQCQKTNNKCSKKEGRDPKPLLVKIAPELGDDYLKDIIKLIEKYKLSGIVATNTTIQRPETKNSKCEKVYSEEGGLSGVPLRERSTEMISKIYKMTDDQD